MKITIIALPLCLFVLQGPLATSAFSANKPSSPSIRTKDHSYVTSLFYRKHEHEDEHKSKRAKQKTRRRVYKHLFRHYGDISFDSWLRCEDPQSFLLSIGYTQGEIDKLSNDFPPLLTLNVHDQLASKVRFLVETLGGGEGRLTWNQDQDKIETSFIMSPDDGEAECSLLDNSESSGDQHSLRLSTISKMNAPAGFFGCSLDREVGPYHAYLQHSGLLCGPELLAEPTRFVEFLEASKSIEAFSELCQQWSDPKEATDKHSTETIGAFLDSITPGLLPVAKKDTSYFVDLLLQHGYNPLEYDTNTGIGPLHWLAGRGQLAGTQSVVQALLQEHDESSLLELLDNTRDPKMGATPFHWAACGMNTSLQGGGGSIEVCRWIIDRVFEEGDKDALVKLCNLPCWTNQSTPLMYAAWGGNLKLCELLLEEGGADPMHADKLGQSALHWAAAAGHLSVCQYLAGECDRQLLSLASAPKAEQDASSAKDQIERQILEPDNSGMTPLDYAMQHDRKDVIEWMKKLL
ncbi:unnamed protein product [Cylindrotheca closterium]|uniref:Calmodulin n=1 Tax=Cylindrotheca closterium TaxID=2856 RepID=A0AAD2CQ47_9STRA|nr:unnamed protein product [Cylindrotheca closterium]